jgi:hypothetical protein
MVNGKFVHFSQSDTLTVSIIFETLGVILGQSKGRLVALPTSLRLQ